MYQFLWIFFIYAFLGWCTEVAYAALNTGLFVNRGFLNGPVCPIYGFGVVIVLACLTPLKDHFPALFLGSVVLTSALEWATGFLLEKIFHQRWWDYTDQPFNLGGYICLKFSLMWGFACLLVVDVLHPTVLLLIRLVPHFLGCILLAVAAVYMAIDLSATVAAIVKLNRRLEQIDEIAAKMRAASGEFGEKLAERVMETAVQGADLREELETALAERREEFLERREEMQEDLAERRAARQAGLEQKHQELEKLKAELQALLEPGTAGQRRLLRAFPRMHSTNHRKALERLRQRLDRSKKQTTANGHPD